MSVSRNELRQQSAELVNKLSRTELWKLGGISRVAELTSLDEIGLPVFSSVRPLSESISVHSGKGLERMAARAGAIVEGIEFEIAMHPKGSFTVGRACELPAEDRMDLTDCFPTRSSTVNDFTMVSWEPMTNVHNGASKLVPSDLIWMTNRIKDQPLMYFQAGSNGLASGASVEDAILSGLYEVVERDAWTINQFLLDNFGVLPHRSPLITLPKNIEICVRKIEAADLKLHLFDITNDYSVPTFQAIILDLSGSVAGSFGGYGCHLDAESAALRAITEAAQARASYISGARDDLFRRQFLQMKRADQAKMDQMFNELPATNPLSEYRAISFPDVKSELRYLLRFVKQFGISEVYVKELGSVLDGAIRVVRVFSPQCEPCKFDHWAPTFRCLSYAQRRMVELAEKAPPVEQEPAEEEEWWKKTD